MREGERGICEGEPDKGIDPVNRFPGERLAQGRPSRGVILKLHAGEDRP